MASKAFDPQNTTRLVSFTLRATQLYFTSPALLGPSSFVLPTALLREQLDCDRLPFTFQGSLCWHEHGGVAKLLTFNRLGLPLSFRTLFHNFPSSAPWKRHTTLRFDPGVARSGLHKWAIAGGVAGRFPFGRVTSAYP